MNIMFFPGFGLEFLVPQIGTANTEFDLKWQSVCHCLQFRLGHLHISNAWGTTKSLNISDNMDYIQWIILDCDGSHVFYVPFSRVPIFLLVCWVFLLDSMFVPGVFRFVGNAFSSSTAWCCQVSPRNATPKRTRYVTSTIHKKLTFFHVYNIIYQYPPMGGV